MRIISGKYKGKIITAPSSLPVRPTTDFAKTGLFNILNNYFDFEEISMLDLFCGTGNISYEFGSRGCSMITAVDENSGCVKFVGETFKKLEMTSAKVLRSDVFRFMETCSASFDIVFADPPYELTATDTIPEMIFRKKILNENGWLILEHQSKRKLVSAIEPDEIRKYGNCAFSIYKYKPGK
ncbi:MAG: RsmD family RNA methyltransferase [Bacteroidetes bacterium]|nr:RsmD family RNA methyltransferase [Bacteroidota bacterium]